MILKCFAFINRFVNVYPLVLDRFRFSSGLRVKKGYTTEVLSKPLKRKIFAFCRSLHVYSSSFIFSLLILFSVTGILLNHLDWISGQTKNDVVDIDVSEPLANQLNKLSSSAELKLDAIAKEFHQYGLKNPSDIQWDKEFGELILEYKYPAGNASVILNYSDEVYQIDYTSGKTLAILNDLHKGRNSGVVWSWVIDLSALIMIVFSITGLVLLLQNKKNKTVAYGLLILGTFSPVMIYWFCVPGISV